MQSNRNDRLTQMAQSTIKRIANRLIRGLPTLPLLKLLEKNRPDVVSQKALMVSYKQLYHQNVTPLSFKDTGFRNFSQHEEDGILLYIFSLIGTLNQKCVEICAGDGLECNTANLIIHHRWLGLLFDGNSKNIAKANNAYTNHPDTRHWPPRIVHAWITKDNINDLIKTNGFEGEIDLLSLDVDGVDYWIWKAVDAVHPRVVVLEFNHLWGPDLSVTVPYSDDFVAGFSQYGSDYAGASLKAFVKLGQEKGYRLVGTNAIATNAFFIRQDIECSWLPEIDASVCFTHPRARFGMQHRYPGIKDKDWIEV
jgi:hypothetical protein